MFGERASRSADRMINHFGVDMVLTRNVYNGDREYDPDSGSFENLSPPPAEVKGVAIQYDVDSDEVNGTTVQVNDKRVLYRGDEVQNGDMLGDYRVYGVSSFNPDGVLVYQRFILRK